METYSQRGMTFTKLAQQGCWALFEGKKGNITVYDVILVNEGKVPYDGGFHRVGETFLNLEAAVNRLKGKNPQPLQSFDTRVS